MKPNGDPTGVGRLMIDTCVCPEFELIETRPKSKRAVPSVELQLLTLNLNQMPKSNLARHEVSHEVIKEPIQDDPNILTDQLINWRPAAAQPILH